MSTDTQYSTSLWILYNVYVAVAMGLDQMERGSEARYVYLS